MKKIIFATVILGIAVAMCAPTKVEKPVINWEEACEISWEYYLKKYNHPNLPWEQQSEEVQNYFLDCWSGSAEEDSILRNNYIIVD